MEKITHYEKTLTSEVLFEGRVITLTKDTALLENGKTATREVVHHHGGACILPYFEDGTICRSCGSCPPASWKRARTPLKPPSGSWARSAV